MKLIAAILVFILTTISVFAEGRVTYILHKSASPTADEEEAYKLITTAMDSALYYYNKYTDLSKFINVYYSTGVPTAEASSNGDLRFGKDRNYMYVGTAMHEIAHTMGMGTTTEYRNMFKEGVFQGQKAQNLLKELDGSDAELHGDNQHFWPYGINYRNEVKSEKDLINHAKIVNAMYQDIFKESFYKNVRIAIYGGEKCMGRTPINTLEIMDCSAEGTLAKIYSIGDNPITYRIEFGDRVIDIPNESTVAGVVVSTYGWNGGAHQRYLFEDAEINTSNASAYYLKNFKSNLYLEVSNSQIIQNDNKYIWFFIDDSSQISSGMKDSSTTFVHHRVLDFSLEKKSHIIFDLKGRRYNNSRISRKKVLFKKF